MPLQLGLDPEQMVPWAAVVLPALVVVLLVLVHWQQPGSVDPW